MPPPPTHPDWVPVTPLVPNLFATPFGGLVFYNPGGENYWIQREFGLKGHEAGTCTEYEHYLMWEWMAGHSSEPWGPNPFPPVPVDPQYLPVPG